MPRSSKLLSQENARPTPMFFSKQKKIRKAGKDQEKSRKLQQKIDASQTKVSCCIKENQSIKRPMKEISQTTQVPSVFSKFFKYLNAGSNSPPTVSCENSTASTTTQQSALFKLYFKSAIFPNQTSSTPTTILRYFYYQSLRHIQTEN